MASFTKFESFVEALSEKVHDLGSDTLKVALTNVAPDPAVDTEFADISEISAGSGYTAGGNTASVASSAQTGGTYKLVLNDVVFTASGSLGPFRYAVLYNSSAANDELIGFWDRGSSLTLASGETFTVDYDGTTGVLTLA